MKRFWSILLAVLLACSLFASCTYTAQPVERENVKTTTAAQKTKTIDKNGSYTSKDDVALYIHT